MTTEEEPSLRREAGLPASSGGELERRLRGALVDHRNIAVVRFVWSEPPRAGDPQPWPDWAVQWLLDGTGALPGQRFEFHRMHDTSVAGFFRDATLGLIELSFDLYPKQGAPLVLQAKRDSLRTGQPDQAALAAAQTFFASQSPSISIDSFDGIIYWVDPPTSDWGAIACPPDGRGRTQRALLHQMLTHHTYAHEIGHVAGYEHAYGISDLQDPVYKDNYCVMGYDDMEYCRLPPPVAFGGLDHDQNLWLGTRLASAANTYRCYPRFRVSPMVRHVRAGTNEIVELVALSQARFGEPVQL
jgi:hypothetical protein